MMLAEGMQKYFASFLMISRFASPLVGFDFIPTVI
jgi:hypothetical protein